MVDTSRVQKGMEVRDTGGTHLGTVDDVEGNRIKLTKKDSSDGQHHYVNLSDVERVDEHVHLTAAGVSALRASTGGAAGTAGAAAASGEGILNRAVDGATPRKNFYLPWFVGAIGLILLLLLLKSCFDRDEVQPATTADTTAAATATAALPVETVRLPNGSSVDLTPNTLNYELQRYLASGDATPRTFTFDKLNFDTGSAAIRDEDRPNVDALAQILGAYPEAAGRVVGYTDARGSAPSNADLGKQRADAVVAALAGKGVANNRITAASGGESNPADTNATAQGQFENRRTELVITAK